MGAPPSPLSSRAYPNFLFAALEKAACAVFCKENRMKIATSPTSTGNPGQPRDLQFFNRPPNVGPKGWEINLAFTIVHGMKRVRVIDSHTGGEPTRTVIDGGPDLGEGSLQQKRFRFQQEHDAFRRALVTEPHGSEVMVGALLCESSHSDCVTGVIFFNNSGCLGMCGHGTIGLGVTLAGQGRIQPGHHRIETPVGIVGATLHEDGAVTIENVPGCRLAAAVELRVPGY